MSRTNSGTSGTSQARSAALELLPTRSQTTTGPSTPARSPANRGATVTGPPGCGASWDFLQPHEPAGGANDFALEAGNCVRDCRGERRPPGPA